MIRLRIFPLCLLMWAGQAIAEERSVFLEPANGERIKVASVTIEADGRYSVSMQEDAFAEHFLSMRPFKCLESKEKHWCHVPYPYEIKRDISQDLVDLEYDFLFVWKGATEYGINLWNGVYYRLEEMDDRLIGTMHEIDMDMLGVPPDAGNLRPVQNKHLHEADPDSHWLPRLVIE